VAASTGTVEPPGDDALVWAFVWPHWKKEGKREERPDSIG
jgi:hypothetical protein